MTTEIHEAMVEKDVGRRFYTNAAEGSDVEEDEDDYGERRARGFCNEENSDAGASQDDEVYEAFVAMDKMRKGYKDQRKKLRDIQKSRGFFKGKLTLEERKQAIKKEKERTRCTACQRIGQERTTHAEVFLVRHRRGRGR